MTIQTDAVAVFREQWATRFIDSITVTRTTSRGAINPATYKYDSEFGSIPYTGEALIRPFSAEGETSDFGDQLVTGKTYSVFVPHTAVFAGDFQPEDVVTIDACALDPDFVGKAMRMLSQQHDSYLTRIELICRFDEGVGYVD